MLDGSILAQALRALGEVLQQRGLRYDVVVAGGSGLLLLGLSSRSTRDLDVVAFMEGGEGGELRTARPFPPELAAAVADVADLFGLDPEWMNPGPTALLEQGLPAGFEQRLVTQRYTGLTLHVVGRFDQVCLKLYALADQDTRSKHGADLRQLDPTRDELMMAARWARTHDPSPFFRRTLVEALDFLGVEDADAEL